MTAPATKTCSRGSACVHPDGPVLPRDAFSKNKRKKDGLQSHCKACAREGSRRWRKQNRDAHREYQHRYREANLEAEREYKRRHYVENREAVLERNRRYREANLEAEREYKRRYAEENRETERERKRRWHEANREKVAANRALRRAVEAHRVPVWADRTAVNAVWAAKRASVTARMGWHVDHIVPLRGTTVSGLHVPENFRLLPPGWNGSKYNRWHSAVGGLWGADIDSAWSEAATAAVEAQCLALQAEIHAQRPIEIERLLADPKTKGRRRLKAELKWHLRALGEEALE